MHVLAFCPLALQILLLLLVMLYLMEKLSNENRVLIHPFQIPDSLPSCKLFSEAGHANVNSVEVSPGHPFWLYVSC